MSSKFHVITIFLDGDISKNYLLEVFVTSRKPGFKDFEECTQPAITCSKLTVETLEQGVKYVQS